MFATAIARLLVQRGPVVDWGPPVLAVGLAIAFMLLAQDPKPQPERASRS